MPQPPIELTNEHPLDVRDPARIHTLAEVLHSHNFTVDGLGEALHEEQGTAFKRADIPVYLRRLGDDPLHALIRLLLLGVPVARPALARALAPLTPDTLLDLGIIVSSGDDFVSPYRLMVFNDLYLVCDRYLVGGVLRADHVTGVNSSSITLAALTIRKSGRALDLGTGCGVQALLLSRHCDAVVATDVSERALNMTEFNAALNGVTNVECRRGSLFEPVAGEQFDVIACNPPYVISPRSEYIFRDAGFRGDDVSRLVVGQAPRHLRPGGYATVLCDWVHDPDADWAAPLRGWVADAGCDALFLRHHTADPLDYAATWLGQPPPADDAALNRLLDEWLAYYADLGIRAISGGAVILRRSDGPHWTHAEPLPKGAAGPSGEHLQHMFAAQDFIRSLPDAPAWADVVLQPGDARLHQTLVHRAAGWEIDGMRAQMNRGLGFEGPLDVLALRLLTLFDGRRPLGELILAAARDAGEDPNTVLPDILNVVRRWVELGFVLPAAAA